MFVFTGKKSVAKSAHKQKSASKKKKKTLK